MKALKAEANIDDLGLSKDVAKVHGSLLVQAVELMIRRLRERMDELDIKASLSLQQSIEYSLINVKEAEIKMNDYWQFVQYGVSGLKRKIPSSPFSFKNMYVSKAFVDAINQWRGHRGLGFDKSLSFATAKAIKKNGLVDRDFLSVVDSIDFSKI